MNATRNTRVEQHGRRDAAAQANSAAANRVLQVAKKLLLKKGYNATTNREIAAASKVSNATIVKYYGGKPAASHL